MAFRYLIYSTGTTFAETIVRESAVNDPGVNEASLFSDFIIPEIQPLYLWRVTGGTDVVPNTDANINAYLDSIAPPPEPQDDASVGFVTGITDTKIDKVTGADDEVPVFNTDGNLVSSGFLISDITGGTEYTFIGSGGTQVFTGGTNPTEIIIFSTPPTGATVLWGNIVGTLSNQTDLQNALNAKLDVTDFNSYTGTTETALNNKLETSVFNSYTGTTQPVIDAAITGVTNLGTGTTLGGVSGRDVTLKSISVLGGLAISGDADNLVISGETNATVAWGDIVGTLSNQTDLQNALNTKLDETVFNTFTGTTLPANYYNKTEINAYTASTESAINAKLDETVFNTFTGTTLPANYYNKTEINAYTGATDTRLDDIESDITAIESDIDAITAITANALTGATNGLTATGRVVELGGALTKDTSITGITHDFTLNPKTITLQAPDGIDILDTDGNDVNIETDGGDINLIGNTGLGVETTKITVSDTQMLVTDGRGTPRGLEYAGDYSTTFNSNSLITKAYADAVVSGLDLKDSVKVATTSSETDIDLTGGTFGGIIDGYTVQDGDRVLVKNQDSNKEQNGIWVYSSGGNTFGRAIDFINPNVSSGAFTFIETGSTLNGTGWVLVTQDPINIGTTPLNFTQFSKASEYIAGVGINISGNTISVAGNSLAGNSIVWTGNTFNVDVSSGTLATALTAKLNVSDFNTFTGTTLPANYYNKTEINAYTGTTATLIGTKLDETVFNTFTGTTLPANYYNKTEINTYTGATDTRLDGIDSDIAFISGVTDTKLDTSVFNAYTGATAPNEIFLIHTGGTELNTVATTAIEWDSVEISGSSFSWTGSSEIEILETGSYELSYNIPYNAQGAQSMAIGGNVILNGSTVIDLTAAAGFSTDTNAAGNLALPTVVLSLTAGDVLVLAAFRTGRNGSTTSSPNGSILIKKKNTLQ